MKSGKVVVVLRGKYAGRKAVIVKAFEDGTSARRFGHALVVGIDRYPRKVTRKMSEKKIEKKSKIRPFIKLINYNHLMPTRYQADFDLKKITLEYKDNEKKEETLDESVLNDPDKRKVAGKAVKKVLEEAYLKQNDRKSSKAVEGVKFFYQRLRF